MLIDQVSRVHVADRRVWHPSQNSGFLSCVGHRKKRTNDAESSDLRSGEVSQLSYRHQGSTLRALPVRSWQKMLPGHRSQYGYRAIHPRPPHTELHLVSHRRHDTGEAGHARSLWDDDHKTQAPRSQCHSEAISWPVLKTCALRKRKQNHRWNWNWTPKADLPAAFASNQHTPRVCVHSSSISSSRIWTMS